MMELEVARRAAAAGGAVLQRYFRSEVAVRAKTAGTDQSYNLVSDADVQSEQAIGAVIGQRFPDHAILGEESHQGDCQAEHLWVVDPLDGTNNFIHHIPHFAVSIAYCRQGRPVCGVVYNPIQQVWYEAIRGVGAWHNGRPMQVSSSRQLNEILVGVGFYYDRGTIMQATLAALEELFRRQIHGIRRFGTASLDLAMVSTGSLGAFFEYELSPWDFAAGWLMVQQAGGRVTTCSGRPLSLTKTSVLATNGLVHDEILQLVQRHLPDQ